MENLTSERRIAYPTRDLTPVPGHFFVVLERGDQGTRVRALLQPGERLGESLLDGPAPLAGYAVKNGANLRHGFSRSYETTEAGPVLLDLSIDFEVADPVVLVASLDSDPLRRLEDEIDALVRPAIRRESLASVKQQVSAILESRIGEIRGFAAALGFKVRNVSDLSLQKVRNAATVEKEFHAETVTEFTLPSERLDIRDLRGSGGIRPDYDYKALRAEDPHRS
jgi:hypothetical protein